MRQIGAMFIIQNIIELDLFHVKKIKKNIEDAYKQQKYERKKNR